MQLNMVDNQDSWESGLVGQMQLNMVENLDSQAKCNGEKSGIVRIYNITWYTNWAHKLNAI